MKFKEKWLDVPSLSQGNKKARAKSELWCGRTSAAMIYNYLQKATGKPDSALIENSTAKKNLVYPDGKLAASPWELSEPLDRAAPGWARRVLFPVADRTEGPVSEQTQLRVLSPVFNSIDRNVPVLFYSGLSTSKASPRHLVVICGYRQTETGVWLRIADPSTMGEARGRGGKRKARQVGAANLEVVDAGDWFSRGSDYWIKVSRLFEHNPFSKGSTDKRSEWGEGGWRKGKSKQRTEHWDQDKDLWCDHCNRPGFVVTWHADHVVPKSDLVHETPGVLLPLEGTEATPDALAGYHRHVEVEHAGGYFPLGANTVWHGGVHLHVERGAKVFSPFAGEIVAARLAPTEDQGCGEYGSHNFILVRQRVGAVAFFSLYMHLNTEPLAASTKALEAIPWLWTTREVPSEVVPTVKIEQAVSYRSAPRTGDETRLGFINEPMVLPWIATEGNWHQVEYGEEEVWVSASSKYSTKEDVAEPKTERVLDEALLAKLRGGGVVGLSLPTPAGAVLWTAGEFGAEDRRTGLVHWEVFSAEKIAFEGWQELVDPDDDFNADSAKIVALVPQAEGFFESDEILTPEELRDFYRGPAAKALRTYACKFISEWGVDLEPAIEKLKASWFQTAGLADRMRPYLWWEAAKAAGVDLPADVHVWHYNPIAFLEALLSDPVPTSVASSPAVDDPGEDDAGEDD